MKATRIISKRTAFRSPWQNGIAERWVGSCRRDLLDHMVALNERHLKRLLSEYVRYHYEDRTHLGSDLRRGHLKAEFVPKLRVEFFHRSDSEGCVSRRDSRFPHALTSARRVASSAQADTSCFFDANVFEVFLDTHGKLFSLVFFALHHVFAIVPK